MARAYLRLDPAFYEKKLEQGYPLAAIGALCGVLCLAELQPARGRFRDLAVLKALLGPSASRQVPFLVEHGDLIPEGSRIYVDGWDEWQEGDVTVKERMVRVRNRKAGRNGDRNPDRIPTVLGGAQGAADSGTGQPGRHSDAYKAFAHCQGHKPDTTEQKWLDDLSKDFGREVVARALYEDENPDKPGLLGRVSRVLRRAAA
jgi:hypothetical protein